LKVAFTAEARADLGRIGDYIAKDSPTRAHAFVRTLQEKALQLADMPHDFPLIPRYEKRGVRRYVCRNYLILYRIEEDQVVVIHVLHGAQDYEALL
jgi:addiction module RelE/StbE family toxin